MLNYAFIIPVCAHPGATDEYGGHVDWENGEYHYHHGYPAHSHDGGVCPYDFVDDADHSYHGGNGYENNNSYNICLLIQSASPFFKYTTKLQIYQDNICTNLNNLFNCNINFRFTFK